MAVLADIDAAANTAASVNIPATDTIQEIHWSYDAAPTNGKITVARSGVDLYEVDVTSSGPGYLVFTNFPAGDSAVLSVTLAAAGAGVIGKINVLTR